MKHSEREARLALPGQVRDARHVEQEGKAPVRDSRVDARLDRTARQGATDRGAEPVLRRECVGRILQRERPHPVRMPVGRRGEAERRLQRGKCRDGAEGRPAAVTCAI